MPEEKELEIDQNLNDDQQQELGEELDNDSHEPEVSQDEQRAVGNGWTNRETWESKGGDPDDWVSAKKFNERGQMIGDIINLKKMVGDQQNDFTSRLDSQKKLHEAQLKVTIADLESKRDDAIDLADRDKANSFQKQIDDVKDQSVELNQDVKPAQATDQSMLDDWNKNNPWILEMDSPKAAYAMERFNVYLRGGKSSNDAIQAMESDVARHFKERNPRREDESHAEGGRSKPGKNGSVKLTWAQLSADEVKWYSALPGAWKTKDEFLQSVADERKTK